MLIFDKNSIREGVPMWINDLGIQLDPDIYYSQGEDSSEFPPHPLWFQDRMNEPLECWVNIKDWSLF